jgi:hypothetical protein
VFVPVVINVAITVSLPQDRAEFAGLGASVGLLAGFLVLFATLHARRRQWLAEG